MSYSKTVSSKKCHLMISLLNMASLVKILLKDLSSADGSLKEIPLDDFSFEYGLPSETPPKDLSSADGSPKEIQIEDLSLKDDFSGERLYEEDQSN